MARFVDLELFSRNEHLVVNRIGYFKEEMRIILEEINSGKPTCVIELHGIYKYFDHGVINGEAITVSCSSEPGSFGWDMSAEDRSTHKELHLTSKNDCTKNFSPCHNSTRCLPNNH